MFPELNPGLIQTVELKGFPFPRRGIEAVYHILLMKDALENANSQGDPEEFVKKYRIVFIDTGDCRFHADLTNFKQRGLYIPTRFGVEGYYFDRDDMNSIQPYLSYRSNRTPETYRLLEMAYELCDNHWTVRDFSDVEKIQNGLTYGQLMWLGTRASFKKYDEPKLDQTDGQLARGLLEYYEAQIGPIDINEG